MTSKEELKQKEAKLIELTAAFCEEHLNEEYRQLCEKLIKKLGRKRSVPFERGEAGNLGGSLNSCLGSHQFSVR